MAQDKRLTELVFEFNHTMPTDPRAEQLPREIFKDKIGEGSRVVAPLLGTRFGEVSIGKRAIVYQNCLMMAAGGVQIDDDVMIAANCQLLTNNHDLYHRMVITCKPIHICQGAWLGAGVTVTAGVTVGKYAVVGAASVVTHDVPDYAVVVGSPARVIKMLDPTRPQL